MIRVFEQPKEENNNKYKGKYRVYFFKCFHSFILAQKHLDCKKDIMHGKVDIGR